MANPIIPSGHRRGAFDLASIDIADVARNQDTERRIREDNNYFEQTGINRPPISERSPLVDNDRPDVANDGDSYDERNFSYTGNYVENAPTRLIEPNERRSSGTRERISASREERNAYVQREQIKEDKEFKIKAEKTKKKYNNAIKGLDINEDDL